METETKKKWKSKAGKLILVLILLCTGIFAVSQKEKFYVEKVYSTGAGEKQEVSILGNPVLEQEFIAKEAELLSVSIDFKAWEQKNGKGSILIEIKDMDDTLLASAEKAVKKLKQSKTGINTVFAVPAQLTKGETYKLVLTGKNVENAKGCFIYEAANKGSLFGTMTVNGKPFDGRLTMSMNMIHFADRSLQLMLFLIGIAIAFVLIPWQELARHGKEKYGMVIDFDRLFLRILFVVSPVVAFFIMQRYSGYGFGAFFKLLIHPKGWVNIFLYGMIWWILYLITNRTKYTAILLVGVTSLAGLVNYFVWSFRGTPIMAADIASVGTAMDVAAGYEYALDLSSVWALVLTIVFLVVTVSLRGYKGLPWKKRLCAAAAFVIPYSVFYTQLLHGTLLKDHGVTVSVWEPSRNYAKNGSLLSFFMSYTYYRVEKPEGYSAKKASEIAERYPSDAVEEKKTRPNVIAIMNEAFSDLSVDGAMETTEDYMPYIHSLSEDTVKGDLYVSVFAGNTANSEYEFLTGCSMAFMPFRAIPYNTYIKGKMPSLTYDMKELGYAGNYAVHPYSKTAWNRNVIYPLLGFDAFIGNTDIEQMEFIRNFASDKTDYDTIIQKYEETRSVTDDPFYTFSVTVQNHGGYKAVQGLVDTKITIKDETLSDPEAEQYINLIKESDDAFRELTAYFKEVEEPTVIVMFGDHQPSLPTSFYEKLFGKDSEDFTLEDTMNKFTVPYVIWANYDIEEEEEDMSANYLSAYMMDTIGAELTGYQKYLLDLYEKVPVITANGYIGDDGVLRQPGEASEYSTYLNEYRILQYNNMFDTSNRMEHFYTYAK